MKRFFVVSALTVLLASLLVSLFGCSTEQAGETVAEGHRRHIRNVRIHKQQMRHDVDHLLLMDEPMELYERAEP